MSQHATSPRKRSEARPSEGSGRGAPGRRQAAASPLAGTAALADGVFSTLRMARALAQSGRRIDLDGLDRLVGLLCAKSLDLPPEDGRQMRATLIEVLDDVDALTRTLRAAPPRDFPPG